MKRVPMTGDRELDKRRLKRWKKKTTRCLSCGTKLKTEALIDGQTESGYIFDVWVIYCPKCRRVDDVEVDGLGEVKP